MTILDVKYDSISLNSAIEKTIWLLKNRQKSNLFFLNSDCLYKAQKDAEYQDILNSADLVLPDGIGLKIACKIFCQNIKDNCNGTDFSPLLIERAAKEGIKIFFLGGRDGIAEKAAEGIRKQISGVQIVGTNPGYFSDTEEVIRKINNSCADILFVAMGVPLQEKLIYKNRDKLNPKLCLGVGALFDYLSGGIPRSPILMRKIHLEWLWRIFIEPRRMFKRYIIDGAKLFIIVLKYKLRLLRSPDVDSESSKECR